MQEKFSVEIHINDEILFSKNYTCFKAILEDFPVFDCRESLRTCKKMTEKNIQPKYAKSEKYRHIKIRRVKPSAE